MKFQEYSQAHKEQEFYMAQNVAKEIYEYMCLPDVAVKIREAHQVNATSHKIQEIILPKCNELGITSEKKGLFANYEIAQLRPDYYLRLNDTGLIVEVERGKTIANNMDLFDAWKCHICEQADYLLLIVPVVRQTNSGGQTRIYEYVVKRIGSFFYAHNYVSMKGCFIVGYE